MIRAPCHQRSGLSPGQLGFDEWFAGLEEMIKSSLDGTPSGGQDEEAVERLMREVEGLRGHVRRRVDEIEGIVGKVLLAADREAVQKADALAEGHRLDELTEAELNAAAEAWLRQRQCPGPGAKPWPLWTTETSQLTQYGPGIWLHFRWNLVMGKAFLLMMLLQLPLMWFCLRGNNMESLNLGVFSDASTVEGLLARTTLANLAWGSAWMSCQGYDARDVAVLFGWLDAAGALVVYLCAVWFGMVEIPKGIKVALTDMVTPDDFTVHVSNLPRELPKADRGEADCFSSAERYRNALQRHFECLLKGRVCEPPRSGLRVLSALDQRRSGHVVGAAGGKVQVRWDNAAEEGVDCEKLLDADRVAALRKWGLWGSGTSECDSIVHQVSLVHDFGGSLQNFKGRWAELHAQEDEEKKRAKLSFWKAVDNAGPFAERPVIKAYVVFQHCEFKEFVQNQYRSSTWTLLRRFQPMDLRFQGSPIRVEHPPSPSDILWDNVDVTGWERTVLKVLVLSTFSVAIAVCILVLSWSRQAASNALRQSSVCHQGDSDVWCACSRAGLQNVWNDRPAGIYERCEDWFASQTTAKSLSMLAGLCICFVNLIGAKLIVYLSSAARQETLTLQEQLVVSKTTLLNFLTLGFVTALVNSRLRIDLGGCGFFGFLGCGEYEEMNTEWFAVVGRQVISVFLYSVLFLPAFALSPAINRCYRWYYRRRLKSWQELKALFTPPKFEMAVMIACQLGYILAAFLFSSGMPVLTVFLCLAVLTIHWMDKYVLLRGSDIPPMYTHHVAKAMVDWTRVAVWLHTLSAVWIFGNPEFFPSSSASDKFDALKSSSHFILNEFLERASRGPALPNFFLLLGILAVSTAQAVAGLLGAHRVSALTASCCCQRCRGGRRRRSDFKQAFAVLKEHWELAQVACSYDIVKAKGYAFLGLQGEVDIKAQRGMHKVRTVNAISQPAAATKPGAAEGAMEEVAMGEPEEIAKEQVASSVEVTGDVLQEGAPAPAPVAPEENTEDEAATPVRARRDAALKGVKDEVATRVEAMGAVSLQGVLPTTFGKPRDKAGTPAEAAEGLPAPAPVEPEEATKEGRGGLSPAGRKGRSRKRRSGLASQSRRGQRRSAGGSSKDVAAEDRQATE